MVKVYDMSETIICNSPTMQNLSKLCGGSHDMRCHMFCHSNDIRFVFDSSRWTISSAIPCDIHSFCSFW